MPEKRPRGIGHQVPRRAGCQKSLDRVGCGRPISSRLNVANLRALKRDPHPVCSSGGFSRALRLMGDN